MAEVGDHALYLFLHLEPAVIGAERDAAAARCRAAAHAFYADAPLARKVGRERSDDRAFVNSQSIARARRAKLALRDYLLASFIYYAHYDFEF
jgi:hypothetical protein